MSPYFHRQASSHDDKTRFINSGIFKGSLASVRRRLIELANVVRRAPMLEISKSEITDVRRRLTEGGMANPTVDPPSRNPSRISRIKHPDYFCSEIVRMLIFGNRIQSPSRGVDSWTRLNPPLGENRREKTSHEIQKRDKYVSLFSSSGVVSRR